MGEPGERRQLPAPAPNRFRRRLTAAFVIVAAASAGVVAVLTLLLAREYRWRNFRSASLREVRVALVLAPQNLDSGSFNRLRQAYEQRSEADLVAVQRGAVFSSSPSLDLADVPPRLRERRRADGTDSVVADVAGRSALVVASDGPAGARYYFFFSVEQLRASLGELARVPSPAGP